MKRIKIILTAGLILFLTIIYNACRKNNDKKETCRISTIGVRTSTTQNTFSYDASGRITRLVAGGNLTAYSYSGNTTTITMLDSGKFVSKTTVITNDAGLAINVRTETNEAGTEWDNSFMSTTMMN